MYLAVTSQGKELDSLVDSRFGRAPYIVLFNSEDSTIEAHSNSVNLNQAMGAGIQTANFVASHNVEVLITGNCGPKAFRVLNAAGIQVYSCLTGTVREAIDLYNEDKLKKLTQPNVEGHWS